LRTEKFHQCKIAGSSQFHDYLARILLFEEADALMLYSTSVICLHLFNNLMQRFAHKSKQLKGWVLTECALLIR